MFLLLIVPISRFEILQESDVLDGSSGNFFKDVNEKSCLCSGDF